jgi:arginyl-tRNA synthetase
VNLLRGGEAVRMSKRAGQFVTLRQLIDELSEQVGKRFAVDVARFFFQMRSTNAHLDFDMDLAIQQAESNPVFYIQYAHARICSIHKQKEEKGVNLLDFQNTDVSLLKESEEIELIKKLADFPDTIYDSAINMAQHTVTRYLQDLASEFHTFYNKCKVLDSENIELSSARFILVNCVRTVLRNGLALLGISAPESM